MFEKPKIFSNFASVSFCHYGVKPYVNVQLLQGR